MKDSSIIDKWLDENEKARKRFKELTGEMVIYNELNPLNKRK